MNRICSCILGAVIVCIGTSSSVLAGFGSDDKNGWADTPQGKFECRTERGGDYNQLVILDGKVLYRGFTPDFSGDGPVSDGIAGNTGAGTGCFDAVDFRNGYLVIFRSLQPPGYGVYDFAVLDFTVDPPQLRQLAEADELWIPSHGSPVSWQSGGFSLRYHGYSRNEAEDKPATPVPHEVWFDFAAKEVSQRK